MTDSIVLSAVTYAYTRRRGKGRPAVEDVTFAVGSGMVCGLAGHNGAGKTTLMSLLAGLRPPDRGSIQILGNAPDDEAILRKVGFVGWAQAIPGFLRVHEVVHAYGSMHGLSSDEAMRPFEIMGVTDHLKRGVGALSTGLAKRVSIAVSLIHDPQVILLDEPFAGLDPSSVEALGQAITQWRSEDRTIIVSSNNLADIEDLIDQVVILQNAKVLAAGSYLELADQAGLMPRAVVSTTRSEYDVSMDELPKLLEELQVRQERVRKIHSKGTNLSDVYLYLHGREDANS